MVIVLRSVCCVVVKEDLESARDSETIRHSRLRLISRRSETQKNVIVENRRGAFYRFPLMYLDSDYAVEHEERNICT